MAPHSTRLYVGLHTDPSSIEIIKVGVGNGSIVASWVPVGAETVSSDGVRLVRLYLLLGSAGPSKVQGGIAPE